MGTAAWNNWRAFEDVEAREDADDELHSDRQFTGSPASFGPFTLTPVIRHGIADGEVGEAVILHERIFASLIPEVVVDGKLAKADSSGYHGGTMGDEIAALVSLELGVRLRCGGMRQTTGIRYPDMDPRPAMVFAVPRLIRPGRSDREILPRVMQRPAALGSVSLLSSFPTLEEEAQSALVRAARAYATAIWWANEDPNQAWLQLVTAAEIAAKYRQTEVASAVELVEELWPQLWDALATVDETTRFKTCELVAPQMKATRTFIDFVGACAPEPPDLRPEFPELNWDDMRKHAQSIYNHRSNALHGGKPFPMPMLEEPRIEQSGAIQESPWGLNSGGLGGIWDAKETPMLLSTFEYVTRGAILKWWGEMATARNETSEEV